MATFAAKDKTRGGSSWGSTGLPDYMKPRSAPRFISNFANNTNKIASKVPTSFGANSPLGMSSASSPTGMVQQRDAGNSVNNSQQMARSHIADNPETIINPEARAESAETFTDGLSGITETGRAATQGVENQIRMQQEDAARAAAANAANAGNAGEAGGEYAAFQDGGGGIAGFAGLDAEQVGYANQIIKIGLSRGLKGDDIQTALMTAMAESSFRNVNYGDQAGPDSRGLFQQRWTQGWGTAQQIMDPNYSINKFYDVLGTVGRGPNLWNNAQSVQRSGFADGSNYQKHSGMASNLWSAYNQNGGISTAPVTGPNGSASWINANNNKYHDYDGAYGAQCVDLYAFYTSGFVGGKPFGVGYAQELWGNHDTSAYVKIGGNQRPQMGDVAIWSNGFNGMGGHVAIVAQDNGDGTIRTLSANSTSAGSRGNTVMINLGKNSLTGYLRPRKLM